jgi:hypothetical protein
MPGTLRSLIWIFCVWTFQCCLTDVSNVEQISRTAYSKLVPDKQIRGYDRDEYFSIHYSFNSCFPCLIETDSSYLLQNVNAVGRDTYLEDGACFIVEVGRLKSGKGCAEVRQCFEDSQTILEICTDENINVFCRPGFGVCAKSVTAYYQVFNVMSVQRGQEIFEVLSHPHCELP